MNSNEILTVFNFQSNEFRSSFDTALGKDTSLHLHGITIASKLIHFFYNTELDYQRLVMNRESDRKWPSFEHVFVFSDLGGGRIDKK